MSEKDDNVVYLPVVTCLDVPAERVLNHALQHEFERVVVIGVTTDGSEYFSSSCPDGGSVLWDLERAKLNLLRMGDGEDG